MNTNPAPHTGDTLRAIREGAGLTQQELCRRVGIHKSTLSRFERGARDVSTDTAHRIAQALADNANKATS